jgi:hypothetical protein
MLNIPIPAVKGNHGPRLTIYQTTVPVADIEALLGHDPSGGWKKIPHEHVREIYEKVQRPKIESDRIKRGRTYVKDRIIPANGIAGWIGAFPALAVVVQEPQTFKPDSDLKANVGVLEFSASAGNVRILADGMGRVATLLSVANDRNETKELRDAVAAISVAVTIFAPASGTPPLRVEEMQQLFHDFNVLAAPVGKGMAIDLDHSDDYVRLVNELIVHPVFANHGGVDVRAQTIGKNSKAVATKISLVKFARAALEGPGSHVDHYTDTVDDPNLTNQTMHSHLRNVSWFLDKLTVAMGDRFYDKQSIHLTAPGWIALGLVFHNIFFDAGTKLDQTGRETMVKRVADIDWTTKNADWFKFYGQQPLDKATGAPAIEADGRPVIKGYGGGKAFYNISAYVRYKIGLDKLLDDDTLKAGDPVDMATILPDVG